LERTKVIIVAVLLAIVAIVLPIAGMLYFSWTSAVSVEHARLELFAQQVIKRASITFDETIAALKTLDKLNFNSCSPEHIERMRELTINTKSIEELGYFQNGLLKCTSWGLTTTVVKQSVPDFTTADGVQITVLMQPMVTKSKKMMALQYKSHDVLVNPERFVDIIGDPDMQYALATQDGYLLGVANSPDAALIKKIIAHPGNDIDKEHLFASAREEGLIGIVIEPRSQLLEKLHAQQRMLLPLGALIAAAMLGIIFWLSRRRLSPLGELTIAVKKQEFIVFYQPIIDLKTGICVGAEALIRWKRPDGSLVSPDFFIPIAEESGLIRDITDQVIKAVVKNLKNLLLDKSKLHIAINLCPDDIKTGRFLPVLQTALANTGIKPQQIWLEITERGFVEKEAAQTTLLRARELGFGIAIDDFGTGYSSLSYLHGFPLDALKIDKSFIDTIGTESATSSVTSHIIQMAKTLNLKIVAEGVETAGQVDYLLQHKVEYGQGWFYSKALSAAEFISYCTQHP
jgi:sensor c-di-GMP phosphodiesterase-like protein